MKYSTKKNMSSSKTAKASSSSSSKTVKSLKSKKKYYVKVRTYKTVKINGRNKTYYGKWSKIKTVKTKYIEKRLDFSSLFCYNIPAFSIRRNTSEYAHTRVKP